MSMTRCGSPMEEKEEDNEEKEDKENKELKVDDNGKDDTLFDCILFR